MPTGSAGSPPVYLRDELGVILLDELSIEIQDETGSLGQVLGALFQVATGVVQLGFLPTITGRAGQAIILQEDGASGVLTEASARLSLETDASYAQTLDTITQVAVGGSTLIAINGLAGQFGASDRLLFDAALSYRLLLEDGTSTFILEGLSPQLLADLSQVAQGLHSGLGTVTGTASQTLDTVTQVAQAKFPRVGTANQTLQSVEQLAHAQHVTITPPDFSDGATSPGFRHPPVSHRPPPPSAPKRPKR